MEQKVNNILLKARRASDYQLRLNNKDASEDILNAASERVLVMIDQYRLNGIVQCEVCKKLSHQARERDFIRQHHVCFGCNKLYGEMILEQIINEHQSLN